MTSVRRKRTKLRWKKGAGRRTRPALYSSYYYLRSRSGKRPEGAVALPFHSRRAWRRDGDKEEITCDDLSPPFSRLILRPGKMGCMIIEREITFRILVCGQVVPAFGPRYRGWAPLPAPPSQRKVKWSDKGATSLSPIKSSIITYAPRRAGREWGGTERSGLRHFPLSYGTVPDSKEGTVGDEWIFLEGSGPIHSSFIHYTRLGSLGWKKRKRRYRDNNNNERILYFPSLQLIKKNGNYNENTIFFYPIIIIVVTIGPPWLTVFPRRTGSAPTPLRYVIAARRSG